MSYFQDPEEIDWTNYWNPKVYIENTLGELKESVWYSLTFTPAGEAVVYEKRRVKGSFMENLELKEFPFDTQVNINALFDFILSIIFTF